MKLFLANGSSVHHGQVELQAAHFEGQTSMVIEKKTYLDQLIFLHFQVPSVPRLRQAVSHQESQETTLA